jgi:polysaccharide biosynthesis/export protein
VKLLIGAMMIAASLAVGQQQPEVEGGNKANASLLAVNDRLVISAKNVQAPADALYRVDADGTVTFPLVGKIRAEGLTIQQFENALTAQLSAYVRSPQVSVKSFVSHSDRIVVAGAFKNPGVYSLSDRRALLDVVSAVGGLESEARTIRITRRAGPGHNALASAADDSVSGTSVANVNLARLTEEPGLHNDILIEPEDVLFAETAAAVFVTGEVLKPGSFDIGEKTSLGLTEAISLAGGLDREAAPEKTKVLRPILNESRRAGIRVDAKSILAGRAVDFRILPNDIVVVPRSGRKWRAMRTVVVYVAPALVGSLTSLAVH